MDNIKIYECEIYKEASASKIPEIEDAFKKSIDREVARMIATSHEYKKPNISGALALVKNYKWEKSKEKIKNLQGINKPVNKEKVMNIAMGIKQNKGAVKPFIVVNQLHGIRPQTPGKKILLDGHHRMEACEFLGKEEVPVYKGIFTGDAQVPLSDLKEKTASTRWKSEFRNLSDKSQNTIESKGILNRQKMLSGLKEGNTRLISKNKEKLNVTDMSDNEIYKFLEGIAPKNYKGKMKAMQKTKDLVNDSGGFFAGPKKHDFINIRKKVSGNELPFRGLNNVKDDIRGQKSIMMRHEINEKLLENRRGNTLKSLGHNHPDVLKREKRDALFLPKNIYNNMKKLRSDEWDKV